MNCIFADYIYFYLNKLIKLKIYEHSNYYYNLDKEKRHFYYYSEIENILIEIKNNTNKIVNALLSFMKNNSYPMVDTDLIRSLISFNLKTTYLSTSSETDDEFFNILIEAKNDIQKFIVFTCQLPWPYYNSYVTESLLMIYEMKRLIRFFIHI